MIAYYFLIFRWVEQKVRPQKHLLGLLNLKLKKITLMEHLVRSTQQYDQNIYTLFYGTIYKVWYGGI